MAGEATSSASSHLCDINNNAVFLDKDTVAYFHAMVAKMLFLAKRARPDILQAAVFLTMRVKKPDEDDYKKQARVVRYLQAFSHLLLTLEADGMNIAKWWIDAACAVHHDMKSQTGGASSMGKGAVHFASKRQSLNSTSSTEAEVVGVSDLIPMVCWTRYFLQEQGHEMEASKIYQGNNSVMLLAGEERQGLQHQAHPACGHSTLLLHRQGEEGRGRDRVLAHQQYAWRPAD